MNKRDIVLGSEYMNLLKEIQRTKFRNGDSLGLQSKIREVEQKLQRRFGQRGEYPIEPKSLSTFVEFLKNMYWTKESIDYGNRSAYKDLLNKCDQNLKVMYHVVSMPEYQELKKLLDHSISLSQVAMALEGVDFPNTDKIYTNDPDDECRHNTLVATRDINEIARELGGWYFSGRHPNYGNAPIAQINPAGQSYRQLVPRLQRISTLHGNGDVYVSFDRTHKGGIDWAVQWESKFWYHITVDVPGGDILSFDWDKPVPSITIDTRCLDPRSIAHVNHWLTKRLKELMKKIRGR